MNHRVFGSKPNRSVGICKERVLIGVDGGQAIDTIQLEPLSLPRLFEVGSVHSIRSSAP